MAAAVIASRCAASETGCPGLCGGWRAGRKTTRGREKASFTSIAIRRCPMWNGSKVPPKRAADVRGGGTPLRPVLSIPEGHQLPPGEPCQPHRAPADGDRGEGGL